MSKDLKIWKINGKNLNEVERKKLDLEQRLEDWIENDISIVSDDLMIIGRQVETDFGGVIDLLCLDPNGDIVIVELKRDKTPRDISAQVLDYASWVKDLSNEKISNMANKYLKEKGPIEKYFKEKFDLELPEILNDNHKMLVVASEIDSNTERIIEYLSDSYGVGINAVTFQYFEDEESGKEFLSKIFLVEPDESEYRVQSKSSSKRKPPKSFEEFEEIAQGNGIGDIYEVVMNGINSPTHFERIVRGVNNISFIGVSKKKTESGNKSYMTILNLFPGESSAVKGLQYELYIERFMEYFDLSKDEAMSVFPSYEKGGEFGYSGEFGGGYLKDKNCASDLIKKLDGIKNNHMQEFSHSKK